MSEREVQISSYCYELGVLDYLLRHQYISREEYENIREKCYDDCAW